MIKNSQIGNTGIRHNRKKTVSPLKSVIAGFHCLSIHFFSKPVCLVEDLLCGASEDDGASFAQFHAGELEQIVLADHHFLDGFAFAQTNVLGSVESRSDFTAQHQRQTLHKGKVGEKLRTYE